MLCQNIVPNKFVSKKKYTISWTVHKYVIICSVKLRNWEWLPALAELNSIHKTVLDEMSIILETKEVLLSQEARIYQE